MKQCTFHFIKATFIFITISTNAQTVSTFGTTPSNSDVAVDGQGFVYVSSEGTTINRFSPSGVMDASPFVSGSTLSRASGLAFDASGDTLYVACRTLNGQGWISKVAPNGTDEVFSSNLYFPGDISFDLSGNLYVTEFNNNIRKVDPNGTATVYVNSSLFNTPIGIAWTPGDTLFVSSAHDGNIYKIIPTTPTPTVQWFAHVNGLVQNWACGFMVYNNGNLFITNGDNKVHKITMSGVVSDYAGSGISGGVDGSFSTAQFEAPNGIGVNTDGSKMYVTEYGKSRVRLLQEGTNGVENKKNDMQGSGISYPNPFSTKTSIQFELYKSNQVSIDIYDIEGIRVANLFDGLLNTGIHKMSWDGQNSMSGNNVTKGIYFCKLKFGGNERTIKLVLM